jgi:hypothetical protein
VTDTALGARRIWPQTKREATVLVKFKVAIIIVITITVTGLVTPHNAYKDKVQNSNYLD